MSISCVGIDYSLSSPAVCLYSSKFEECKFYCLTKTKKYVGILHTNPLVQCQEYLEDLQEIDRYVFLSDWVSDKLSEISKETPIFLEGYSMASTGRVFNIAENTAVLKLTLWLQERKYIIVPPTVVKKSATGKGNADKNLMEESFVGLTNLDLRQKLTPDVGIGKGFVSDIIDSYYIARHGISLTV